MEKRKKQGSLGELHTTNQFQMRTRAGCKKIRKLCGCHLWKLPFAAAERHMSVWRSSPTAAAADEGGLEIDLREAGENVVPCGDFLRMGLSLEGGLAVGRAWLALLLLTFCDSGAQKQTFLRSRRRQRY